MLTAQPIRKASAPATRRRLRFSGFGPDGILRYEIASRTRTDIVFHPCVDTVNGCVSCDCEHHRLSPVISRIPGVVTAAHYEVLCHHAQRAVRHAINYGVLSDPTPAELAAARHQIVEAKRQADEHRLGIASPPPTEYRAPSAFGRGVRTELVEEI